MPAEPLKIILRGDSADCAIVSIAMYTDRPYADVMREVVKHDPLGGANGLTDRVIRRTMSALNHPVRWTKHVDLDEHYGLLYLTGHVVVLKRGQVIETKNTWCSVWDVEDYIVHAATQRMKPLGIFLSKDA